MLWRENKLTIFSFFKPYLYCVTFIGFYIGSSYLLEINRSIFSPETLFIMGIIIGVYLYDYDQGHVSVSMAAVTILFALVFFDIHIIFPALFIAPLLLEMKHYIIDKKEDCFNEKLLFNYGQMFITVHVAHIVLNTFNINLDQPISFLYLTIVILSYYIFNWFLVLLIMYLSSQGNMSIQRATKQQSLYLINSIFLIIALVYLFDGKGLIGLVVGLGLLIPLQKTNFMYSKLKQQEAQLFRDELTQTYNRVYLDKFLLNKVLGKEKFHLVYLDFDNFKQLNDEVSHLAGDEALKQITNTLEFLLLPQQAELFRYGGDEFCIYLPYDYPKDKFKKRLEKHEKFEVRYRKETYYIYLSLGIHTVDHYPNQLSEVQAENQVKEILSRADQLMYNAKAVEGTFVSLA